MSGLGTRRKGSKAKWEVLLPPDLANRAETLIVDPTYKRPVYGFKSQLVTELLEKWVSEREAELAQKGRELLASKKEQAVA